MGREAACTVRFGTELARGKALLETNEILFRGDFRLKLPFRRLQSVTAREGELVLRTQEGEDVIFTLGREAASWAARIKSPPGRLDKLGVKPGMTVALVGSFEADFVAEVEARADAVTKSRAPRAGKPGQDLVFFAVKSPADLDKIPALAAKLAPKGALWLVRRKGPDAPVGEAASRGAARAAGLVDTKVVSFSASESAERYVVPLAARPKSR